MTAGGLVSPVRNRERTIAADVKYIAHGAYVCTACSSPFDNNSSFLICMRE
jgi:hypothetical protein